MITPQPSQPVPFEMTSTGDSGEGESVDLIAASVAAVEQGREQGLRLRTLGGVAVALRCPSASRGGPLARQYSDLDLATVRKDARGVIELMRSLGYKPADRFNAVNGARRLLFDAPWSMKVDVFVDEFELCHTLSLKDRLEVDAFTLPLADLLLTKLQVAKLNRKDVTDIVALLVDHELTDDEEGINSEHIASLLAGDWGWWRTGTETLERVIELLPGVELPESARLDVERRALSLRAAIDAAPKNLRWKARARIGDHRAWRVDPDEV